jgi:hypothetical protein
VLEINHGRRIAFRDLMIDSEGGAFDYDEIYHEIPDRWRYRRGSDCDVDGAVRSGKEEGSSQILRRGRALLDQLQRWLLQRISLWRRRRVVSGRIDAGLPAGQLRKRPQEVLTNLV